MSARRITQQDMDASRLVFVSVKDAKPRRKVAVPVPDGQSWDQFIQQVQTKLKLVGVESIYLVQSGEKVTRLDELQDIDELQVVEAKHPPAHASPAANGYAAANGARTDSGNSTSTSVPGQPGFDSYKPGAVHRIVAADTEIVPNEEDGDKYTKKSSGVKRSLQHFFPSLFQPGLPVTRQDVNHEGPRRTASQKKKRKTRGLLDPKNIVVAIALITLLGTLIFLYSHVQARLPRY